MSAFYLMSPPDSRESCRLSTSLGRASKAGKGKEFSVTSVVSFLIYRSALPVRVNYLIDSESHL